LPPLKCVFGPHNLKLFCGSAGWYIAALFVILVLIVSPKWSQAMENLFICCSLSLSAQAVKHSRRRSLQARVCRSEAQCTGWRITGGRQNVSTMSQVLSSIQYLGTFAPRDPKSFSCPGRHLTSVRPCVHEFLNDCFCHFSHGFETSQVQLFHLYIDIWSESCCTWRCHSSWQKAESIILHSVGSRTHSCWHR